MTCLKPLESEKRRPGRGDYSGLECGSGRIQRRWGWGDKGDIDSAAPTTVPTGHQVKEGGKAPTDCARKRKEQGRKWREGYRKIKIQKKRRRQKQRGKKNKDSRDSILQTTNQGPLPPTASCF